MFGSRTCQNLILAAAVLTGGCWYSGSSVPKPTAVQSGAFYRPVPGADNKYWRTVCVHMIWTILRIVFEYEDGRGLPVRAAGDGLHETPDRLECFRVYAKKDRWTVDHHAFDSLTVRPVLPPGLVRDPAPAEGDYPFGRDLPVAPSLGSMEPPAPPPPWQDEDVLRDHPIPGPMFPEDAPAPPPPPDPRRKRDLLFSSTSRKERERGQGRTSELLPPDFLSADPRPRPPVLPPLPEASEAPPPSFDEDSWPRTERSKRADIPLSRRGPRMSSKLSEPNAAPPRNEDQPAATVLKSGIVDGMAYSLYSDGSIEAQMPEGMMRFGSIDELREHLNQRS